MKIGYVRVSTVDQKTERQETALHDFGVDKMFIDKASGKCALPAIVDTETLQKTE